MLNPTDPTLAPDLSLADGADWFLPGQTLDLLARVAPTRLPLLCTACFGAAFRRVADAVHRASALDDLLFVDLRRNAGTLPAGLPDGDRAGRSTLALDGIEHLHGAGQTVLAALLVRAPYRLICATDASLDVLRAHWRPDLLARLSTVTVATPALARRGDAIADIARQRLAMLSRDLDRAAPDLTPDAVAALADHPWPGDLAELDAVLSRTLLTTTAATIDGVALRFRPDVAAWSAGESRSQEDAPGGATRLSPSDGHTGFPDDEASQTRSAPASGGSAAGTVVPSPLGEPAPPAATDSPPAGDCATASSSADDALIATLPAPGLFRTRRGDEVRQAPVAAGSPRAPHASATPPLEALAVELAHQLKNPLVTIKSFVGSLESLCDHPQELDQFRALTEEAVGRMDQILDDLLEFARLRAPVLEQVDVLSLLRDALRSAWRKLAGKQVELDAPDAAALRVSADREHARFAFATLARHIAETIEPRGRLAITVEPPTTLCLEYRESGAITHLRGVSHDGESGLPLALLLVRGALARAGGDAEIALESNVVSIRLRLSPP